LSELISKINLENVNVGNKIRVDESTYDYYISNGKRKILILNGWFIFNY
jgi:hypothetical protein